MNYDISSNTLQLLSPSDGFYTIGARLEDEFGLSALFSFTIEVLPHVVVQVEMNIEEEV